MPITVKKTYDPTVALERSNLESRSTLLLQQEGEKKDGPPVAQPVESEVLKDMSNNNTSRRKMSEMAAYIYILQDGDDKGTRVYKIGRTVQNGGDFRKLNRLQSYSYGTMVYNTWNVNVSMVNAIENKIKEEFKQNYHLVRGYEWFEGDLKAMKKTIQAIIEHMDIEETTVQSITKTLYDVDENDIVPDYLNILSMQQAKNINNKIRKTRKITAYDVSYLKRWMYIYKNNKYLHLFKDNILNTEVFGTLKELAFSDNISSEDRNNACQCFLQVKNCSYHADCEICEIQIRDMIHIYKIYQNKSVLLVKVISQKVRDAVDNMSTYGPRCIFFKRWIEARWAFAFEALKWNWKYEPYEIEGYTPDFIIQFANNKDVLVEIINRRDIWNVDVTKYIEEICKSGWKGDWVLLGTNIQTDCEGVGWIGIGTGHFQQEVYKNNGKLYENYHEKIILRKTNNSNYWALGGSERYDNGWFPEGMTYDNNVRDGENAYHHKNTDRNACKLFEKIWNTSMF